MSVGVLFSRKKVEFRVSVLPPWSKILLVTKTDSPLAEAVLLNAIALVKSPFFFIERSVISNDVPKFPKADIFDLKVPVPF